MMYAGTEKKTQFAGCSRPHNIKGVFAKALGHFTSAVILVLTVVAVAMCQVASQPDRGVVPIVPYDSSGVENINIQNGNLNLEIPLASLPPIAGGKLSFTLNAYYNSKLYDTYTHERRIIPPENNEGLQATRFFVEIPKLSDVGGWRIGGFYSFDVETPGNVYVFDHHLDPTPELQIVLNHGWGKVYLVMPDGAKHEMRPFGYTPYWGGEPLFYGFYTAGSYNPNQPVKYYSVDGSYITATIYPPNSALSFEVNFPDGTKIQQDQTAQRIIDPNGNKIKIFGNAEGTHYQDELTGREIRVFDNTTTGRTEVWYKTVTGIEQKVEVVFGTTAVRGKFYSVNVPPIWGSQIPASCIYQENWGEDLTVIREIIFPQTETGVAAPKYSFAYNSDETETTPATFVAGCNTDPPVSTWPDPSKGLGELSQMTTPSGAVHKYIYQMDGEHITSTGSNGQSAATNVLAQKKIEHDGITDTWLYGGNGVTNPDGSSLTLFAYNHWFGNPSTSGGTLGLGGLVYREVRSSKIRIDRRWVRRVFSGAYDIAGGGGLLVFNPVVTEEYTNLLDDTGAVVKMSATTFEYDYNGNITKRTEYDWFPDLSEVTRDSFGIPNGIPESATVLRVITNSFHNSPGNNANSTAVYAKTTNSILTALKESNTGNRTIRLSYDGQAHTAPPTHGNITTIASWDSVGNQWLETVLGYDSYGNVTSKTDESGNTVTFVYGDNTHALVTEITADPNNGTGPQTSYSTYDFDTGLPLTRTDVNGNVSSIDYTNHLLEAIDPFGRPGTSYGPQVEIDQTNKRQIIKTYYEDSARRSRVETDLFDEGDQLLKVRTTKDQLGRIILNETNENGSSTYPISSKTVYDFPQRVMLVSNAARATAATTDGWTRTTKDTLGRVVEVATFSGAAQPPISGTNSNWTGSVSSSFYANSSTVSDQAGRQRRSLLDPLGRLIRVDEPNNAGQLGNITSPNQPTVYTYDVLGNLTGVTQNGTNAEQCGGPSSCSQSRTFTFSSLSRMLSASNPESGTTSYEYHPNGTLKKKTDARNVAITYQYDGLNRVTSRTYSDGTPAVSFTYDTLPGHKGRPVSVSSSVSTYSFSGYDALGRPTGTVQTIGSRSYTFAFTYDLVGNVKSISYPSGNEVNYGYDISAHLTSFSGTLGGASRTYASGIIYDAGGRVTKEQFGTDTAIYNKLRYNSRGQLAEIRESTSYTGANDETWNRGKIINDFTLQCTGVNCNGSDNNGNLRRQTVGVPNDDENASPTSWSQQYEYDSLNRVKQVDEFDAESTLLWKQGFVYDRYGNRRIDVANTSQTVPRPEFEVELGTNRLLAPGDSGLAPNARKMRYDSAGNLINDSWTAFGSNTVGVATRSYDAENRMTEALDKDGGNTRYYYDGEGRRVRRVITNQPEVWQVYGLKGELLAEYPADGPASAPLKEYGYRNDQLLISAEPSSASAPPPTSLVATPHNGGPNVALTWTASGAGKYRIEKAVNKNGPYTLVGTSTVNSFVDSGVSNGTAYLYKVCAANSQDVCTSSFSNVVLGLAFSFATDPTIKTFSEDPGNATVAKAAHITELRTAVDAVRTLAGLPPASWTNTNLQVGVSLISVNDVRDLRARLNDALQVLAIPFPTYTDATLKSFVEDPQNATPVRAVHIRELRQFVRSGIGGSGGSNSSLRIHWHIADQLGTPRIIFDQTGTLTGLSTHDYLPFGEELTTQGLRSTLGSYSISDQTRQQFTSKERDPETELDYFGARYYSSAQGRFISADAPLTDQFPQNPQSWNLYSYTRNNPVRIADKDGRITPWDILDIISLGMSVRDFWKEPSFKNFGLLVADGIGAAVPLLPVGSVRRAVQLSRLLERSASVKNLENATEVARYHELSKEGLIIATGADNVRSAVGITDGGPVADLVTILDNKRFIISEVKEVVNVATGTADTAHAVTQLTNTAQHLLKNVPAGEVVRFELVVKQGTNLGPGFQKSADQLLKFDSELGRWVPVRIMGKVVHVKEMPWVNPVEKYRGKF